MKRSTVLALGASACLIYVGVMLCYFAAQMGGCAASGSAKSGGSEMSNSVIEPDTKHWHIENYGDGPLPPEVLNALPKGTVENKHGR